MKKKDTMYSFAIGMVAAIIPSCLEYRITSIDYWLIATPIIIILTAIRAVARGNN